MRSLRVIAIGIALIACAPVPRASLAPYVPPPSDPALRRIVVDPLRCTARVAIPRIADVFEAQWSPDGRSLAMSHLVTIASGDTITGYEEEQRIAVLDLASGSVTERGRGSEPMWSGSGALLSYWRDESTLWVTRAGAVLPVVVLQPTQPDVRWVGEELIFVSGAAIQSWSAAGVRGVSTISADVAPRYPRDDISFSADGARFVMTRYASDGTTARYMGMTQTGALAAFDDGGATFTEWAPRAQTLLMRSAAALSTWNVANGSRSAPIATPSGTLHLWAPDGRLFTGAMSPSVPAGDAFDAFIETATGDVATVPNLLGIRSFSGDGRYFAGAARTGLYSTELELFLCGASVDQDTDLAHDRSVSARAEAVASDGRRFVRPAAGAITQYVQGIHTGIDVAAPFGTVIVASDDGVVDAVGWVSVGGRRVCVLHAGGLESCGYHAALSLVSVGEPVVRGQPIALMGLTGQTTGPHVHWEAKRDGVIVDPLEQ